MTWDEFVAQAPKCRICGHPAAFEYWIGPSGIYWNHPWWPYLRCEKGRVPVCGMCQGSHNNKRVDAQLHWTPGKVLREWNRGHFDDQITRIGGGPVRPVNPDAESEDTAGRP